MLRQKGRGPYTMKIRALVVCLFFASIGVCSAKEHDYQKGKLVRMDSSSCGTQEKGSKTVAGEIFGTDGQHKQTQEMLCQEYILQSEHLSIAFGRKTTSIPFCCPLAKWLSSASTRTSSSFASPE